jgi:hypothetical protein
VRLLLLLVRPSFLLCAGIFLGRLVLWHALVIVGLLLWSWTCAPVWDICTVDEAIVSGREVVALARCIICFICWRIRYWHVLVLKIGSDL